jgi:hypothetical protein
MSYGMKKGGAGQRCQKGQQQCPKKVSYTLFESVMARPGARESISVAIPFDLPGKKEAMF